MLIQPLLSALSCALLFTTTSALPSRTHCHCSITTSPETSPSPPTTYRDSLRNPDTLIASTPTPPDICAALGPSLENLRHTNPALYESYISKTDERTLSDATAEQKPISTTVLLRVAAHHGFQNLGVVLPGVHPDEEPRERIVCRTEDTDDTEAWTAYQVSWVTLVVLQVVVALVIVACVAEGVMIGLRWYVNIYRCLQRQKTNGHSMSTRAPSHLSLRPSTLRLSGEEKRLLAIPQSDRLDMRSPGAEKKLRVYASSGWKVARYSTYVEDEDDEFNRPVM